MTKPGRLVDLVTDRSKTVIVVLFLATLLVGAGGGEIEESAEMEMFEEEPAELETERYVQAEFDVHDENTTELLVMVRNESGAVLKRESLLESLRYQQSLTNNETVGSSLVAERPIFGIENVVAWTAIQRDREERTMQEGSGKLPPLDDQIAQLEAMSDEEVEALVSEILDPDGEFASGSAMSDLAFELLPESYEPGTTVAEGRLMLVVHETDGQVVSPPELSDDVRDGQSAAAAIAEDVPRDEYRLTGAGLMLVEEEESTNDSLTLLGPFSLLFVLVTLAVAYRDLLDIALGVVGTLLVLTWTFGAMGWLGIDFNLMMIAPPILLIGLSIDYCIHVVMRYREYRTGYGVDGSMPGSTSLRPVRESMHSGLVGLGPALVLVTVTATVGFLSVRTSGVPFVADFGVVTAAGIVSALVIFGAFVPACKVEVEEELAARGYQRSKRAFGTTGYIRAFLERFARVSYRRPVAIVFVVLLVSSMGAVGATQLGTDFSTDDYIAEDPPDWSQQLPEPFAPGGYEIRETHELLHSTYLSPDQRVHIVSQGAVTPETLERVARAENDAREHAISMTTATGEPAVTGPVSAMWAVAETDESFAALLDASDTTGNGVPDRNVETVLDEFLDTAPELANQLLHRTEEGEYDGLQILVTVDGTEDPSTVASEMRDVGEVAEGDTNTVTVVGDAVTNELVQRQLASTVTEGLVIALVTVFAVLAIAFRYKRGSAALGAVTLLPVLFGLSWILGGMYVAGIPFSFATAMIGSIAIGLGVDYAIHVSERFGHELDEHGDVETALVESVVGTGGALLGSALTTAAGFGVLAFSLVPVMQQFGLLIALTLVGAFVASVLVFPSLLVLWSRWAGYDPNGVPTAR